MSKIVPKQYAPGVDICGVDQDCYIIRSDIGCFMKSTNFHEGKDLEVFGLHNSCQGGDHYLAHEDDLFYIIKGNQYRCVSDMKADKDAVVFTLHPNCCRGNHYLSASGNFYIIFQDRGVYRRVKDLHTDEDAVEFTLHPNCKDGLYYWGVKNYYYFVKPSDEWGVQYCRHIDFHENLDAVTYSFHADVVNFLPGGLAITKGPTFGRWEALKTISNESKTPITWTKNLTKNVGFDKHNTSTIEKRWQGNIGVSFGTGHLTEVLAKVQFSLSGQYGGSHVSTDAEGWHEATVEEESFSLRLQPNQKICIWQYVLGLGQKPILFSRSMKLTNDSTPPTDVPLPPSKQQ